MPEGARRDAEFCKRRCRQAAFRLRRRRTTEAHDAQPLRIAYADPPYPGKAARYYEGREGYAGEVDHYRLVLSLATSFDGWALSTGAYALRELLPFCPPEARIAPWVKPNGVSGASYGPHNAWEPVIYCPARKLRGGVRDWLRAKPARGGGDLPGRKPLAFCGWLFDLLGMVSGDELVDLFPGTGIVSRAWREVSPRTSIRHGGPGLPHAERWTPHSLRDTFVTLEAEGAAGDLAAVAERSRHASIDLRARTREPAPPRMLLNGAKSAPRLKA
jgi:hypothetical protein